MNTQLDDATKQGIGIIMRLFDGSDLATTLEYDEYRLYAKAWHFLVDLTNDELLREQVVFHETV